MNINVEELTPHFAKMKDIGRLMAELMEIVDRIPYYCGSPDCIAPGCQATRQARDKVREIYNAAAIPNPDYKR